jgi:hypothetical protein
MSSIQPGVVRSAPMIYDEMLGNKRFRISATTAKSMSYQSTLGGRLQRTGRGSSPHPRSRTRASPCWATNAPIKSSSVLVRSAH